jgi:hypothetical protein
VNPALHGAPSLVNFIPGGRSSIYLWEAVAASSEEIMDAAEADVDAKLYKASGDLIPELKTKLPHLLWHDPITRTRLRTHILTSKCEELRNLVSYQVFK